MFKMFQASCWTFRTYTLLPSCHSFPLEEHLRAIDFDPAIIWTSMTWNVVLDKEKHWDVILTYIRGQHLGYPSQNISFEYLTIFFAASVLRSKQPSWV